MFFCPLQKMSTNPFLETVCPALDNFEEGQLLCIWGNRKFVVKTISSNQNEGCLLTFWHAKCAMSVLLDDLQIILYRSLDFYVLYHICHKVNLFSLQPLFLHQIIRHSYVFYCVLTWPAIFLHFCSKKRHCILMFFFWTAHKNMIKLLRYLSFLRVMDIECII